MIKLAIKNIKTSFLAYRNIYALLLFTQFMAVLILLLIYGIISSSSIRIKEKQQSFRQMYAFFDEDVPATEVKEILPEIFNGLESEISSCVVFMDSPEFELTITSPMVYDDGKYYMPKYEFEPERIADGRYISGTEMTEGTNVCIVYGEIIDEGEEILAGDNINISGTKYEVVGVLDGTRNITRVSISINACTEIMEVSSIILIFDEFPSHKDYKWFNYVLRENFGFNPQLNDLELVDLEDIISFNSIILISVIVGAIAAFDTILVYNYLLKKRKRQMAILSIEGATKQQQRIICFIEVLIITLLTTILGVTVFELFIKNAVIEAYGISVSIYTVKAYMVLLFSYVGTIFLGTGTMITISTRKRTLEMRRS